MIKTILIGFLVSSFFLAFTFSFAQETSLLSPNPTPSPLEYALPYPGILPDHPLYFLKSLRDQILTLLITNPIRKTEFYILLADKHLNMGNFLVDKGKPELAVKSVEKGVGFLKKAETTLFQTPASSTPDVGSTKDRFEKSLLKHQEVVTLLISRTEGETQTKLDEILKELRTLFEEYTSKR